MIPVPSGGAVACTDRVLQGRILEVDGFHVLARRIHRFLYGDRYLARLAIAEADPPVTVTDDGERGKAELPAALHHLGYTVDRDQFFKQSITLWLCFYSCHK
jgi:hypothetical protein